MLLMGGIYALLHIGFIQTSLVACVTYYIESTTGVKIQIEGVDFRPMRSLVLEDVLLRDFREDTLFYCEKLSVKIDSFNLAKRVITIEELLLDKADVHLWVQDSTNNTNVEMLLEALNRNSGTKNAGVDDGSKSPSWWMGLHKITFRNSRFTYQEERYVPVEYEVNWTDVDCRDLNLVVTDLDFGSPMHMTVSDLSFVEKSGLRMKDMGGKMEAGSDYLLVTDCHIELERSRLELKKMEYHWRPNQHDWKYFTTRMQQYYELMPSSVSFIDLAYFNEVLRGITNTMCVRGIVSNTVKHLEGQGISIEFGNGSIFQGNFKSFGLPDVWNTKFQIELQDAHFQPADLASIYLPWFKMYTPVPKPFYNLAYLDFERVNFEGTLSDFLIQAQSNTPALDGYLNFRYQPVISGNSEVVDLKGDFAFNQVDVGKLSGLSFLQNGRLNGNYRGQWNEQGVSLQVQSRLLDIVVNDTKIEDVSLDLMYENEQLNLLATIEDELLAGGCALNCDLNDQFGFFSAKGQLACNDLKAFGFGIQTDEESLEFNFDLVHATQQKRSFSNFTFSNLHYANKNGSFFIDNISLEDNRHGNYNTTTLKSDVVDAVVDGNFRNIRPIPFVSELLQSYLPAYTVKRKNSLQKIREELRQFDFEYAIDIKDVNRVLRVIYPGLSISAGSQITSFFHRGDDQLNLMLTADTIQYQDLLMLHSKVMMTGNEESLQMNYSADKVAFNHYQLLNLKNELSLTTNLWNNRINWSNWESQTYSGGLETSIVFKPGDIEDYIAEIQIHPGVIVMDDTIWRVNPSQFILQGKELEIQNFSIHRGEECFSMQGNISTDPQKSLLIRVENFDLSYLTRVAFENPMPLFGTITGSLMLQDYYNNFIWLTDLHVHDLGIQQDTLGTLRFSSYWDTEKKRLMLGMENLKGKKIPFALAGYYMPQTDTIDVHLILKEIDLKRMNAYIPDLFSEVGGKLSGTLSMSGLSKDPNISGFVHLDSVGLKVNVLNTHFFVHDSIRIDRNRLLFQNFLVKDKNGSQAIFNGEYRMWDNRYKLHSEFNRFLVMDTRPIDNERFYGKMTLSGLVELDNLDQQMNVTINARTEAPSQLFLPLTSGLAEQSNHFLHFSMPDDEKLSEVEHPNQLSDIHLNANLEVNDQLNVEVIFDPTVGDILHTSGNGNIRVTFDKDGNLNMFGEYQITEGEYLFTLSNLVNKKFVLTPGGIINWSGSPYDAILDINAVYHLKTSISELLPVESNLIGEENLSETGRKVPVECILNLSENLTNPTVMFDVNFPTLDTQSKSYLQSLFSSQDEVNKQMFSLLVLNRFYRTDEANNYGNQAQTAGVTTLTEMFSNQISRWFSKYSDYVDIGLAYRFGDRENSMTSDELEVEISTQLLNDRVTISANGNMDMGGNRQIEDNRKTNIAGDFDVEVKLNKQGSLKMKAYSHTNEKLLYNNTETIQGVGVSYQESFDTFWELLQKYFGFLRRNKKK